MKITPIAGAFILSAGLVYAQTPPSGPPSGQTPPAGQVPPATSPDRPGSPATGTGEKTKKMAAEVVSTDAAAKTITVKNLAGSVSPVTLPIEDKAEDRVSSLKAGDKVTLTCKSSAGAGSSPGSTPPGSTAPGSTPPGSTSPGSGAMAGSQQCQAVTDISKSGS